MRSELRKVIFTTSCGKRGSDNIMVPLSTDKLGQIIAADIELERRFGTKIDWFSFGSVFPRTH